MAVRLGEYAEALSETENVCSGLATRRCRNIECKGTKLMIPVYVVSLPDCTDRRETIARSLDNLGISFEFFDAVDGRKGLAPEHEGDIDRPATINTWRLPLSDAEFACALSHMNIYRRIVAENIAYAVVLEDDADPRQALVRYLEDELYWEADLTLLYSGAKHVSKFGSQDLFEGYSSYQLLPHIKTPFAIAYVVSNHAARVFLKHGMPVRSSADWPNGLNLMIKQKRCRVVHPFLVRNPMLDQNYQTTIQTEGHKKPNKRRFLGIYVPPARIVVESYFLRFPYKVIGKRLA